MKYTEKELIEHISERLKAHEERYVPGAWEDFISNKKKKRKTGIIWWPASAAAILLIGFGLFLYTGKTERKDSLKKNQLVHQKAGNGVMLEIKGDPSGRIKKTSKKYNGPALGKLSAQNKQLFRKGIPELANHCRH